MPLPTCELLPSAVFHALHVIGCLRPRGQFGLTVCSHDNCLPGFGALNTVLSHPDQSLNAFKTGQHSDVDFYTWMETHPVQQGAFHRFMEAQFASLPTWLDAVDFAAEVGQNLSDEDVAFVDVGGGNGQQCALLKKKVPELKGRVVLQDRPPVLEKALSVEGMEKMSYDYLTEQPVKGWIPPILHPVLYYRA